MGQEITILKKKEKEIIVFTCNTKINSVVTTEFFQLEIRILFHTKTGKTYEEDTVMSVFFTTSHNTIFVLGMIIALRQFLILSFLKSYVLFFLYINFKLYNQLYSSSQFLVDIYFFNCPSKSGFRCYDGKLR